MTDNRVLVVDSGSYGKKIAAALATAIAYTPGVYGMMPDLPAKRAPKKPDPERQAAAEAKRQRRIERNRKQESRHD